MSASSKKKLRAEENASKLTEKQTAQQKEAKKLKIYTVAFVALIAAMVITALTIGIVRAVTNSGVQQKNTTALTVGDHKLSSVELNYFYIDAVNNFISQYGSYAQLFGLDTSKPLDQQVTDEETGATWADDFLHTAQDNAKATYALADEAEKAGFTLSQEELDNIDLYGKNLDSYAKLYGYSKTNDYLRAMYGNGSTKESYLDYYTRNALASAYYNAYSESRSYTDEQIAAKDEEDAAAYNAYSYHQYYLSTSRFLEGGTVNEDGTTTYSEEEKAAAQKKAEEAAKVLTDSKPASVEDFDTAIAALPVNKDADPAPTSTAYTDQLGSKLSATVADWVKDSARKAGDITYIPSSSTSTAEDGTEVTTVNGYYVVYFDGSADNRFPLKNARHILVSFEGGTTDEYGTTTYSDEEKAAAKEKAEEIYAQWQAGDATEDSFAALAAEKTTDPGSQENGGLYENIYPGQMVTAFNDWCFDDSRKPGDTGIVETDYGYHIMYFSGDADITYRDYMITEDLRSTEVSDWNNALIEAMSVTEGNTKYIRRDLVLSSN